MRTAYLECGWHDGQAIYNHESFGAIQHETQYLDPLHLRRRWANHDVTDTWDTRLSRVHGGNVIWTGKVRRDMFEEICKRDIEKYLKLPQYYKIDGKPVFMIYDIPQLIAGLGGVEQTAAALQWFKAETVKAGFSGLELQLTMWSQNVNYSGFDSGKGQSPENAFVKKLGFTSTTHYQTSSPTT